MNRDLPIVAIEHSPRNEARLWLHELFPDSELSASPIEAQALYSRHRAEIRLLLDLVLFVPVHGGAMDAEAPKAGGRVITHPQEPDSPFGSMLR
jgi:hypothetical protein